MKDPRTSCLMKLYLIGTRAKDKTEQNLPIDTFSITSVLKAKSLRDYHVALKP